MSDSGQPTRGASAVFLAMLALVFGGSVFAQNGPLSITEIDTSVSGHVKLRGNYSSYPDDSVFRQSQGANSSDYSADMRLLFAARKQRWSLYSDYQFIALDHDSGLFAGPLSQLQPTPLPNDDTRLWDLTHVVSEQDDSAVLHRLDRLNIKYSGEKLVARLGRQVISWGNGLLYNPVDIFNPFDPAAVDKEYKTGDDMLYGQYLLPSGDDLQATWVQRRDAVSGSANSSVASYAIKYHGLTEVYNTAIEYDVLAAQHYNEELFALGFITDIGTAVWRGDLVYADTDYGDKFSLVTNLGYSWVQWNKNVNAVLEYYYNGFGLAGDEHSVRELQQNPALLSRIERSELHTIGRHYIAASATVEVTPLLLVSPNVFVNAGDGSTLLQLVASYDYRQNLQMLGAINVPVGSAGSEFGGIHVGADGLQLSQRAALFLQLGWYF